MYRFLRSSPKYTGLASAMVAANSMLAFTAVVAGLVGSVLASKAAGKKDMENLAEDVRKKLNDTIAESEDVIARRRNTIAELQAEIEAQEQQIKDCRIALEQLPKEEFVALGGTDDDGK